MNALTQKEQPLHIHKWDSFLSVIFEDAALRVDDIVEDVELGRGRVKEVFYHGKGNSCLIHFFDAGDRLRRREDLELGEHGWLSMPLFHGENKRIKHDKDLRKLLDARHAKAWGLASKEQLELLEGLVSSDPV